MRNKGINIHIYLISKDSPKLEFEPLSVAPTVQTYNFVTKRVFDSLCFSLPNGATVAKSQPVLHECLRMLSWRQPIYSGGFLGGG